MELNPEGYVVVFQTAGGEVVFYEGGLGQDFRDKVLADAASGNVVYIKVGRYTKNGSVYAPVPNSKYEAGKKARTILRDFDFDIFITHLTTEITIDQ